MENYRKSAHCTYDIKYHIVWITKYRKPVLMGKIAIRTRELIRKICQTNDMEILAGYVGKDHIYLLVSVSPNLSASKLVQYMKGNTSRKLQMEYKELNKEFWGRYLLARGHDPEGLLKKSYYIYSDWWNDKGVSIVSFDHRRKPTISRVYPVPYRMYRYAEDGIDMKVLQYLMGHSSARITNDVYNHVTEDRAANEVISIVGKRRNMA